MSGTLGYKRVGGLNMDYGKTLEGSLGNRDRDDLDEAPEKAPMVPLREKLTQLRRELERNGWYLVPEVTGDVAGFNVYTACKPDHKLQLKVPGGFKYLERVRPDDGRFEGFVQRLLATINTHRMEGCSEFEAKQWAGIAKSMIDRPKDGRTDVAMTAMGMGSTQFNRAINGAGLAHKYVPPVEWFPEAVQAVDVPELFSMFLPPAETEALLIMLGKTMLGNAGSKTTCGDVPDTKFAGQAVLIGFDGGEGKSSLMSGFIGSTMRLLGYKTEVIDPASSKFGNLWVTADFAYCDELNEAAHKRLLGEWYLLKSVVSGLESVRIEAKGIQSWEVRPTAQPFFASNHFSYTDLQKADGGSLRRYYPMQCYGAEESEVLFGDGYQRIAERWSKVAKGLGVTVECLTARVLRYALDLYMTTCGIVITNGMLQYNWVESRLYEVLGELRGKFRISVDMNHGKRLIDAVEMATLTAIALVEDRYRSKVIARLHDVPLMPKALHTVVEVWRNQEELPEALSNMMLDCISNNVRLTWDAQTDSLHQDCMSAHTPTKVWERVISCLTVKGKEWGFQKSISAYTVRWNTKLMVMPQRLSTITPEVLEALPERTYNHLKELGEALLISLGLKDNRRRK